MSENPPSGSRPQGSRGRRALWFLPAAAVAVLDLWSKELWQYPDPQRLSRPTVETVVENWLYVRAIWNEGGVWSLAIPPWILLAATALAVPLLAWWILAPRHGSAFEAGAKALVLGGAGGNLWDRAKYGKVRDWIDVCFGNVEGYHYPTFNVADAALVAGIAALLLAGLRRRPRGTGA